MGQLVSTLTFPLGGDLEVPFEPGDLPCPNPIEQSEFLALFEKLVPQSWLIPIRDTGPGYEVLAAYAKTAERVSRAVARFYCGSYILSATGGNKATALVAFFRDNNNAGPVTIKAGTVITTSRGDRRFVTAEDVTLTHGDDFDLSVVVPVTAAADGYQWNVPGPVQALNGEILPGEIDTIVALDTDPPFGDPTIQVQQVTDATGGVAPMLDGLGLDRGLPRNSVNETDDQYRARIRTLPDTVSPDAIKRNITAQLKQFLTNPSFDFIETFQQNYQNCWDATPPAGPLTAQGIFDPNLFVYDDPRPPYPFENRWLDENDFRGAFIVVISPITRSDSSLFYDDPGESPADFSNAPDGGERAPAYYDLTNTLTPAELQGAYDGEDVLANAIYANLYNTIITAKPAGVFAALELKGQ